jgi:peptidoglycan biosynthesis protein MviN/MurJ (putative lipid II flippase)
LASLCLMGSTHKSRNLYLITSYDEVFFNMIFIGEILITFQYKGKDT